MRINLVNNKEVISTKYAARYLKVSYNALIKEIDTTDSNGGDICWQARIADKSSERPILGFDVDYLREVLNVIGNVRQRGKAIFTNDVKEKLKPINKRWRARR